MSARPSVLPWYRQPEPWLLLLAPAVAVVAGGFTWWLAASANNSLVVDDYYKQGKAINQTLARDEHAAQLGVGARIDFDKDSARVLVRLHAEHAGTLQARELSLRFVHATRAELDQHLLVVRSSNGIWRADSPGLPAGRWSVHLEDLQAGWRLVQSISGEAASIQLGTNPPQNAAQAIHATQQRVPAAHSTHSAMQPAQSR